MGLTERVTEKGRGRPKHKNENIAPKIGAQQKEQQHSSTKTATTTNSQSLSELDHGVALGKVLEVTVVAAESFPNSNPKSNAGVRESNSNSRSRSNSNSNSNSRSRSNSSSDSGRRRSSSDGRRVSFQQFTHYLMRLCGIWCAETTAECYAAFLLVLY